MPRPPAFMALTGSAFTARRAGNAPKTIQARADTASREQSTRQSVASGRLTEFISVESAFTKIRLKS